ncbi:hypothetical protein ACMA5I_09760 [Paracoccaceae bacterium GXU_MW_L88]
MREGLPESAVSGEEHDLRGVAGLFLALLDKVNLRALDPDDAVTLRAALTSGRALAARLDEVVAQLNGDAATEAAQSIRPIRALADRIIDRWQGVAAHLGVTAFRVEAGDGAGRALFADHQRLDRLIDNLFGAATVQSIGAELAAIFVDEGEGLDLVISYGGDGPRFLSRHAARGLAAAEDKAEALGLTIARRVPAEGRSELVLKLPGDLLLPGGFAPERLPNLSSLRIAISGVDVASRLQTAAMLRSMGAVVRDAGDALDRVDILLVDLDGLDGREAATVSRLALTAQNVPLVAMASDLSALPDDIGGMVSALAGKPLANLEDFGGLMLALAAGRDPAEVPLEPRLYEELTRTVGPDLMPDILGQLSHDLNDIAAQLEAALAGPTRGKIRVQTHLLSAVASLIGATRLGKLARQVSHLSLDGEDEPLRDAAGICLQAVRAHARDAARAADHRRETARGS